MKITVSSDDGVTVLDVYTGDIDFAGHSMNRVILKTRIEHAVNTVSVYELMQEKAKREKEKR